MKKRRDILRNKKRVGRGLRTGCGGHSHANTHQLKRILTYLETEKQDCMTNISRETGIAGFYVKDALLFLCGIKIIKKINVQNNISRSKYYKISKENLE